MDFRRFLGREETLVLPYLGGATVTAPGRGLRVAQPVAPGWWRFRVQGRVATALEPAEPDLDALAALPRRRGHLLGVHLVDAEGRAAEVAFPPEDEPPPLSPATARRWPSGDLIFEQLEFETEAEEAARQALEDGRSLADVKGAPASLRAAFAFALLAAVGREHDVPVSPGEARADAARVADEGRPVAEAVLRRIAARRGTHRPALAPPAEEAPAPPSDGPGAAPPPVMWNADAERVDAALRSADAQLLRLRRFAGGQLEVVYRFLGLRFVSIVASDTLRVLDAGVCLDGEDDRVTLDSLPGVIREAIDTGALVITARVPDA